MPGGRQRRSSVNGDVFGPLLRGQVDSNVNGKVDVSASEPLPLQRIKLGFLIGPPIQALCRDPPQRHHLNATVHITAANATPSTPLQFSLLEPGQQ